MTNRYRIYEEILGERGLVPSEISRILGNIEGIGNNFPREHEIGRYARKHNMFVRINLATRNYTYGPNNLIRESDVIKIVRGLDMSVNDSVLEEALRNRGNE